MKIIKKVEVYTQAVKLLDFDYGVYFINSTRILEETTYMVTRASYKLI